SRLRSHPPSHLHGVGSAGPGRRMARFVRGAGGGRVRGSRRSDGGSSHGQQTGGRTPSRPGQGRLRATRGGSLPDGGRNRSDGWHPPALPPRPVKSALERVGRLPYVAVLASLLGVGALAV